MVNIAFVGDSRVRELFYAFVNYVAPGTLENQEKMVCQSGIYYTYATYANEKFINFLFLACQHSIQ